MANTKIADQAAIDACDSIVDRIDLGATNAEGRIRIYDGTQPANPDTAPGATLLAELNMSAPPAFGAAAMNGNFAEATANTITDDTSADATGTATWFRYVDRDAGGVVDGDVSDTGGAGDLKLNSTSISAGAQVSITSAVIRVPTGE